MKIATAYVIDMVEDVPVSLSAITIGKDGQPVLWTISRIGYSLCKKTLLWKRVHSHGDATTFTSSKEAVKFYTKYKKMIWGKE